MYDSQNVHECGDCGNPVAVLMRSGWNYLFENCKCDGEWEYGHRSGVIHFICGEHKMLKYDVSLGEYTRGIVCCD